MVKDYVHMAMLRNREMFVSLAHPPGEAQADFGEAPVVIAGVEQKAHYLAMDLQHSDRFPGYAIAEQDHGAGTGVTQVYRSPRERAIARQLRHRQDRGPQRQVFVAGVEDPHRTGSWPGCLPARPPCASSPPPHWSAN
jgi:hypothetical protein